MKIKSMLITFLLVFSLSLLASADVTFPDVSVSAGYSNEVNKLADNGIIEGDESGNFRPEDSITRAEFSAVLCRAMGVEATAETSEMINAEYFTDVPPTHWAAGYINTARDKGAINGMGNNMFYPEEYVTNEQVIKMLVAAWGYMSEANSLGGYPNGYMEVAKKFGVTDTVLFNYGNASKRWVVSMFVYGVLNKIPLNSEADFTPIDWVIDNSNVQIAGEIKPLSEYTGYIDDPVSILKKVTAESAKYESHVIEQYVPSTKFPFSISENVLSYDLPLDNNQKVTFSISNPTSTTKEPPFVEAFFDEATSTIDISSLPVGTWEFGSGYTEKAVADTFICKITKKSESEVVAFEGSIFRYTYINANPKITETRTTVSISNDDADNADFPFIIKAESDINNSVKISIEYPEILDESQIFNCSVTQEEPVVEISSERIDGKNEKISPFNINNLTPDYSYHLQISIFNRFGDSKGIKGTLTVISTDNAADFNFTGDTIQQITDGYELVEWESEK